MVELTGAARSFSLVKAGRVSSQAKRSATLFGSTVAFMAPTSTVIILQVRNTSLPEITSCRIVSDDVTRMAPLSRRPSRPRTRRMVEVVGVTVASSMLPTFSSSDDEADIVRIELPYAGVRGFAAGRTP